MHDNLKRIYALAMWSVERRARGWYIKRTNFDEEWRGPFTSEISACLMIARGLRIELAKRDRMAS